MIFYNTRKGDKDMENNNNVPYIVYESSMTSSERFIKRLIIALIISIALLFISNLIWLKAWTSYDYTSECETTTYSQDGQGTNIIGNMNEVE